MPSLGFGLGFDNSRPAAAGGAPAPPAGYAYVTTLSGAGNVTTASGASRITVKVP